MFAVTSLKKLTRFLTIVIAMLTLTVIGGSIFIQVQENRIAQAWLTFQADSGQKARVLSEIRGRLGYGGMIHTYKNFVLRGNVEDLSASKAHLLALGGLLNNYSRLSHTTGEDAALEDIATVLAKYGDAMEKVERFSALDREPRDIDKAVYVDDSTAIRGLNVLETEALKDLTQYGVPLSKSFALAQLRHALGYDGLIHHFKNYVLRLANDDRNAVVARIQTTRTAIKTYKSLGPDSAEDIALDDLSRIVDAYEDGIAKITAAINAGTSSKEIDAAVRVDDTPGLRALDILERQLHIHITENTMDMNKTLTTVSVVTKAMSGGAIVFIVLLGVVLIALLRYRVRKPIERLSADMRALSKGQSDRFITTEDLPDEVRDMAKAVLVFKKNTERMVEAENSLTKNSEELEIKLAELQDLKERADEQAAQAVSLAEGMALAREEADKAMKRAASDEQRIRAVVNAVTDAIIVIDAKGIIDSFNPAAESMFGYSADEVVGRNVKLLMPDQHKEHHDGYLARYLDGNGADVGGKLREFDAMRRNGTAFPIELSVRQMQIDGKVMFAGAIRDITERRRAEEQIRRMALTDSLTGLANRNLFNQRLDEALATAKREGWMIGLMMLDLDKFKPVNDTYGHPAGDALLQQASVRMKKHSRETDTVARLGGDEFAIIVVHPGSTEDAVYPAERIVEELTRPFNVLDNTVQIGTSIGIAFYPNDAEDAESLIHKADQALYAAKEAGRNTHRVYDPSMDNAAQ